MPTSYPVLCGSIAGRPGSFGVAMHTAAYRAFGLDYTYVAFGTEDTAGAIAAMRALGLRGLGVSMPHKVRIIEYLDAVDDDVRAIGAVNTVVNEDGRLIGHNVDWLGAIAAVREVIEPAGCRAAVVGAGGGARAIAYGLIREGAQVTLFNRGRERGEALAHALGVAFAGPPDALLALESFDLLVHATPVGFHAPTDCLIPASVLRPRLVVFDAVPIPIETALLRAARTAGCATLPGIRMQLHQAMLQFRLYTGLTPDLRVMEEAVSTAIARL
jgi:shikimate dehydrogenase